MTTSSTDHLTPSSNQNLSTALLGAFLNHALRDKNDNKVSPESNNTGKIIIKRIIPVSFALKII